MAAFGDQWFGTPLQGMLSTADTHEPDEFQPAFHPHTLSLDESALMLPSCMTIQQPTWVLMNASPRLKSISSALNMLIAPETEEIKPFPITTVLKHIAPGEPHIDILVSSTCLTPGEMHERTTIRAPNCRRRVSFNYLMNMCLITS